MIQRPFAQFEYQVLHGPEPTDAWLCKMANTIEYFKSDGPYWVVDCVLLLLLEPSCWLSRHWIINMKYCHYTNIFCNPVLLFSDDNGDLKDKLGMFIL